MSKRRFQYRPQLEAFEDRLCPSAGTAVLPISAFLSQQGTSEVFTPPVPDQIAWTNSAYDPGTAGSNPTGLVLVDYTGQEASYLLQHGINLHTKITGFVTETPLGATGAVEEVSVNLEAVNALTWVAAVPPADQDTPAVNTDPLELGYRVQDLVANPALKPALSDAHFQITFQEQTGAPLPDLVRALILGDAAPPDFSLETYDFQSWGAGALDAATPVGKPGQTAVVTTSQVGVYNQPDLPGTLADGTLQEPINLVPVSSPSSVAYLNGTLFVTDLGNGNDNVQVTPAAGGGATVSSNLGGGTFAPVNAVVVSLSGGNSNVQVGNLPGAVVTVSTLDGNNNIMLGNAAEAVVSVGGGNDNISTGNVSLSQVVFVGGAGNANIRTGAGATVLFLAGGGNDNISAAAAFVSVEVLGDGNTNISAGKGDNVLFVGGAGNVNVSAGGGVNTISVVGNGNHNITAAGDGDSIEVLGDGNNNIQDAGVNDLILLGGNANNNIDNDGAGSFTELLFGTGNENIRGRWGRGGGGGFA
jgi:hypothetical protein